MENTIYIGLSRQMALRRQLDVTANNIANMNTPGFKTHRMLFLEYLAEPDAPGPARDRPLSMVSDQAVVRDLRPGQLSRTDNPLDIAIDGEGYLVVETPAGPRYTRNGHLTIDSERRLVDGTGLALLDTNDQPIEIPPNARDIRIGGTGEITTDAGPVGRLRLVRFDDEFGLTPLGGGLHVTNEAPKEAENSAIVQGMIEDSNVQPIVEMTSMIEISRQYQSTQKLLNDEHERLRTAIRRLGQMNTA
jgi:flagellar basal-body rod protein FlgF